MIRIYPSRHEINIYPCMEGRPVESHPIIEPITIADWMAANTAATGEQIAEGVQPISFDVNGESVAPKDWATTTIGPEDDVRIYPVPFAAGAAFFAAYGAYIAVAVAAIALVYALSISADSPDGESATGDRLDLNPAKANSVKLYEPIREVLGRAKVYPDYALQPVSRFVSPRDVRTSMFLVVGAGKFAINPSQMKIGETPFSAFGDEVSYTIYEPGADVSGDPRSENWYSAPEVGASKSATAGLDLESPSQTSAPTADAVALADNSITLIGDNSSIPDSWVVGTIINLIAPQTFTVTSSSTSSVIAGDLDELDPFPGMLVSLSTQVEDIDLIVDSFSPYVPPVPGVGGNPSSVVASAAPSTYNFSGSPLAWTITYQGVTRNLSLTANYVNMSGLVAQLTSQLSGIGLVAQDDSGRLKFLEPSSPYRGGSISMSSAPVPVFGVAPVYVVGNASTGGTPEVLANITLRYEDGTKFLGVPNGQQRLGIGFRENRFRIDSLSALTLTVSRLDSSGNVDSNWPGFDARTILDFRVSSTSTDSENWIGPFMGCPEGELIDRMEWDIYFPVGLQNSNNKGDRKPYSVNVILQWADAETGTWITVDKTYREMTRDAFGVTEGIDFPYRVRPIVRMRKGPELGGANSVGNTQWYALRGRLHDRPLSYPGVTCIALSIRTGSRLSAQSDRQVSMVVTRIYEDGEARKISSAFEHVCKTLPDQEAAYDSEELADLEAEYWTPRGETFDHSFDKQVTVKEALQTITAAGMSFLAVEESMVTAIREGVREISGAITPHEQAGELSTSFVSPSADDYSGVDVKYIHPVTFAVEIVECRIPGLDPLKIETLTLEGVQDRTRAWRIGMRRLMKYQYQRLTHKVDTELSALAYRMLDHVVLTDDIPGNQTISSIIVEMLDIDSGEHAGKTLITSSEELDWSFPNPRVLIKNQDGSVSALLSPERVGSDQIMLPTALIDTNVDWSIEPPRMVFCSSAKVGYSAMIDSIDPDTEGRCSVIAKQYSDIFYQHDDATPPAA